jgi:hypothetical protein
VNAVWDSVRYVAVMVTVAAVFVVVIVNDWVVEPADTVTVAGTVAAAELLVSVTAAPPVGAAALSVISPVTVAPPVTVPGVTVTAPSAATAAVVVAEVVESAQPEAVRHAKRTATQARGSDDRMPMGSTAHRRGK